MHFLKDIKFLTLFVLLTVFGQAFAVWDGSTMVAATKGSDGFYVIDSEEKLAWFANESNKNHTGEFKQNAKLDADLDMGSHLWIPICAGAGGTGINKITYCKYNATFDGKGHTISNLKMVSAELGEIDSLYVQNIGFIGALGSGTIKGLTLENVIVLGQGNGGRYVQQSSSNNAYSKPVSIGTLVGWSSGTIENCRAIGEIVTSGEGQSVGGLVGNAGGGFITGSVSEVSIDASGIAYAGGIVGYTKNTVSINSCVYAGSGVHAEGSGVIAGKPYESQAGAIVGNPFNGSVNVSQVYYDNTVIENACGQNGTRISGDTTGTSNLNSEEVVCALNGGTWDGDEMKCNNLPSTTHWSVGVSGLSYDGSDGYTVTFDANGGAFSVGAKTSKPMALNASISAEEIATPSRGDNYSFAGWATSADASVSSSDLGTVTGPTTIYAVWKPIYTITFDANQGTFPEGENTQTVRVVEGKIISEEGFKIPGKITINGVHYSFTGWALTQEELLSADAIPDTVHLADVLVDRDMTLYAVWTAAKIVTVTFNPNGHGTTSVEYVNIDKGQSTQKPDDPTAFAGYSFLRWCETSEPCKTEFNFGTAIEENITLYASWEKLTYNITYDLNGATGSHSNPLEYTVETASFAFENPTLSEGFDFIGWFYDKNLSNPATSIKKGTTGDKNIYAKWSVSTYTVTYRAGSNGSGEEPSAKEQYGTPIELAGRTMNREGYVQDGWSTSDEGSLEYQFGQMYSEYKDIALYPHWVRAYTISYQPGDGEGITGEVAAGTKIIDVDFDLSSETFTRTGYTQDGWEDENGNIVSSPYTENADITLYPHWVPETYTITYVIDGVENAIDADAYTVEEAVTLATPTRAGYTFDGWYANAQLTGDKVTGFVAGTYTGDQTFYAKWLEIFTITYAAGEGEGEGITGEVATGTKTEGENATLSSVGFARDGYTQIGWKTEDASATFDMGATYTTDASVTLYPIWELETYNITYHNIEGATNPNPTTYTVEDLPITLNDPTKAGYTFEGWYIDALFTGDPITGIETRLSEGDGDLYAKWELAPSAITVTASTEVFEYDGNEHAATCSYEGIIPVGYSITMTPTGSVQDVGDGDVTASCNVAFTENATGDDATALFSEVLEIVNGTISVKAKEVKYGAVTISTDENGASAIIDGTSEETVSITDKDNVVVKAITFNRTFPVNAEGENKMSTLVLPFSIAKSKVEGAEFYELNDVVGTKVRIWKSLDVLEANTPYIIRTTADHLTFNLEEDEKISFNTEKMNDSKSSDGLWTIHGVYSYKKWEEGDPELGRAYGYTAKATNNLSVGKFARNGAGAYIKPLRAYLLKASEEKSSKARRMLAKSYSSIVGESSPDEMDVEIVDRETGETTVIGKLNPATGEIRMINEWFDMKGRKLNSKPTTKGIYYFNGKQVIVK